LGKTATILSPGVERFGGIVGGDKEKQIAARKSELLIKEIKWDFETGPVARQKKTLGPEIRGTTPGWGKKPRWGNERG